MCLLIPQIFIFCGENGAVEGSLPGINPVEGAVRLAHEECCRAMGSTGRKLLQIRELQEQRCITVTPHKDPHPNPD